MGRQPTGMKEKTAWRESRLPREELASTSIKLLNHDREHKIVYSLNLTEKMKKVAKPYGETAREGLKLILNLDEEPDLSDMDRAISSGMWPNAAELLRDAVRHALLKKERDKEKETASMECCPHCNSSRITDLPGGLWGGCLECGHRWELRGGL